MPPLHKAFLSGPQKLPGWQRMGCCIFLALSFVACCLHKRPVQTLEKNSKLSTRGRHCYKRSVSAGKMLGVLIVSIRVQAGEESPTQLVLGI